MRPRGSLNIGACKGNRKEYCRRYRELQKREREQLGLTAPAGPALTFESLNLSARAFNAFLNRIEITESGCWLWKGPLTQDGYGYMSCQHGPVRRITSTSRVAYLLWMGPIPEGLEPDHRCPNRKCICPEHLELITHKENMRRGRQRDATRTHCWRGHELTLENTRKAKGWRVCIACDAFPRQQFYLKKKKQPAAVIQPAETQVEAVA